ncbi:MAG: cofactor-independent phosphoglycerate mutase [Candidatus Bathyarchaeota archaeon]|nr:MAG: cofactor-independent phosphoglycerate mutase [Candidatus Bathyarchaeota archaeon]
MKYLLIIGDGMADYPVEALNGKTPLQVANKPNMDELASEGRNGILRTIPENMGAGSDVANLSILGYNPEKWYTGRGPLEAATKGIHLAKDDIAFRCNLITEENDVLMDYSAGHITSDEAKELMKAVEDNFGKPNEIDFHAGVSYRNLLVFRNGPYSDDVLCTPPHDTVGVKISETLPKAKTSTAEFTVTTLKRMIYDSKKILENHPVNVNRVALGKRPGNMIWPWGQGKKPSMPTLQERYGISGAVISAVDVIKGVGIYAGMKVINVPGATGFYDTNYEGKADYALEALKRYDMVLVHVEAPDEAGHSGDHEQKIRTLEDLDRRLIGRLLEGLDQDCTIAVLPDHVTPIKIRTHARDPVPFTICSPLIEADEVKYFDEVSARKGGFGFLEKGDTFMRLFVLAK